jgi:starch synthase (maltosyl-transferring)
MASKPPDRIVIQYPQPSLDGGRYAVKRCVGDPIHVSADIFRDGHELLRAAVRYRRKGRGKANGWREASLQPIDAQVDGVRWTGGFEVDAVGDWEYEIHAWVDRFGTWRDELSRKLAAGQTDLAGELSEGRLLLEQVQERVTSAGDAAAAGAIQAALDPSATSSTRSCRRTNRVWA